MKAKKIYDILDKISESYELEIKKVPIIFANLPDNRAEYKEGKIFIDKKFVTQSSAEEIVFAILHEYFHHILFEKMLIVSVHFDLDPEIVSIAAEFEINEIVNAIFKEKNIKISDSFLKTLYFAPHYGLPRLRTLKEYYDLIVKNQIF